MSDVDIRVNGKSDHFIDFIVCEESGRRWRTSGIYGWPESGQKFKTWTMLNNLGKDNDIPWMVGGDFNEVLQESEKQGGSACDFNNICAFRDCLDKNGLRDLDTVGHQFTWRNNRTDGFIEERLDRVVATTD